MCVSKSTHAMRVRRIKENGKLTYRQRRLERLYHRQSGKCHWCDTQMNLWWEIGTKRYYREYDHTATIEHFIPRAKGGTFRQNNLVAACSICNWLRGHMDAEKFEWVTENPERYARWKELRELAATRQKKAKEKNDIIRFNKKIVELACMFFLIDNYSMRFQ